MTNDIMNGLRTVVQEPLDARVYKLSEAELANLGASNQLAYSYISRLKFQCVEEGTEWEWREPKTVDEVGLLPANFIYPDNWIKYGITYSLKEYNFFLLPVPLVVENIGAGTPIYHSTDAGVVKISAINSPNIIIEEQGDGSIKLTAPDTSPFKYLLAYYINNNYVPTIESPSDGSIIRPFVTFDQARAKMIGTGTILNPEFTNATFILQTHSSTALNPTINTLRIIFENSVNLAYTGSDLYVFDSEILYPLIPKDINNEITQSIDMSIGGQGRLIRTTPGGFIRSIGSKRGGSITGNYNYINIRINNTTEDYLGLFEYTGYDDSIYEGDVLNSDGITLVGDNYTPSITLKWTTLLNPTVPLFYIKGYNLGNPGYPITGTGTLEIVTMVNTGLYVEGTILAFDKLIISPYSDRISVVQGATFVVGFPGVYEPKNAPAIVAKDTGFYINSILFINGGTFGFHGFDKFFKIEGVFSLKGTVNYDTNFYIKTFADLTSTTQNFFELNGKRISANLQSKINYLINSNIVGTFSLIIPNTIIEGVKNISQNPSTVIVSDTKGTISSINEETCISGATTYPSKAAAKLAGLISGSFFIQKVDIDADDLQSGIEYKITTAGVPSLGTVGDYFVATGTETGTGVGSLYTREVLI